MSIEQIIMSRWPNFKLERVLQLVVFTYQAVAVLVFVLALFIASTWIKLPFMGAFFEPTLVKNAATPNQPDSFWPIHDLGVGQGGQLIKVAGQNVQSSRDVEQVLSGYFPGENIPVAIRSTEGITTTYDITLQRFPAQDRNAYLILPSIVSLIFLLLSLWIFGLRRDESAGRAFALFVSSMGIVAGTFFDLYTTHRFSYLWMLALPLAGGALIDLTLSFPQKSRVVMERPYLHLTGYLIAIGLAGYSYIASGNTENPTAYLKAWYASYFFNAFAIVTHLGVTLYRSITSQSPVVRSQARTILAGMIVSLGPIGAWSVLFPLGIVPFSPYVFFTVVLFPLVIGYSILRFRLLRTDIWLRQGIVYVALTVLTVIGYALLVSGLSLVFKDALSSDNPLLIGVIVFILALLLDPLRKTLLAMADATFFRGQRIYDQRLRKFAHELTSVLDIEGIAHVIRKQIMDTLAPQFVHIYTFDPINNQFTSLPDEDGQPSSDIRFLGSSALAKYFSNEKLPLYLDGITIPVSLVSDRMRLQLLGAQLFLGMNDKEGTLGWLALGPRLSGQPYLPQDLTFLENLADQASVAIGRVQTVVNLERRIQEMNALTRVSQGVNVTLTFNDVMELISAQTGQIIPATEFHVMLYSKDGDYYYYAFCVENHERLEEKENVPLPSNFGLGQEVFRRGRPIYTQDYLRECQARNINPAMDNVYAWMGVPLNAGAETIGSLGIGSRNARDIYSKAQLDLLQAIADQTAGAIVKARLLQETQQRAYQLSTLNDLTRQLTSTLELEPLLQNILKNAVSILNCEAGSLFLVDEQTGDLVFNVTVGPVATDLIGQRVPAGSGIVGQAAETRAPVVENSGQTSSLRFSDTDEKTGFTSKSLLAVPLLFKDRVIGVIEVVNRLDGLPFVEDDQTLLSAFAGQAAVAMENARLYTLTDQELAARVEELSVLQRIDRELNASLEIDRALRITLEWAMRQSHAEAGLVGIFDDNALRIMTEQGYGDLVEIGSVMNLDMKAVQTAVKTVQPQQVTVQPDTDNRGVLPMAFSQVVIPIRREASVIGLILLESTNSTQQDVNFLNRLSDHAAIAISNAQLYAEIQRANDAKSEFVSFVAHELKNPMTSIKGYTELISKGVVGPITEAQTNFLNTIHSNVERMSTLVSDLNDNSKIEAGRLRLDYKAVNMLDIVEDVVKSTSAQTKDKQQTIELKVPDNLPNVWADPTRVGQVLVNLVSNSIKYTPEGGNITIGSQPSENQWDPEGAEQVVHIWVKDDGIGIAPEDQRKIFQKFFRSEDSKAREVPGSGLGLNITRSLVEMQGGRIWFESEFRKGTTFHFTVPVIEE
jgi:signal transduction histidine kinase